jgi:hypothetical protein
MMFACTKPKYRSGWTMHKLYEGFYASNCEMVSSDCLPPATKIWESKCSPDLSETKEVEGNMFAI